MNQLKIKATDEIISLERATISCDIEQFTWSFSADVATKTDLQKLIPPANLGENYVEVIFTLGSQSWDLIIEDTNCNDDTFSYSVTGKSISMILAEPYSLFLTRRWLNSSAQAICEDLCSAGGISLSWNIPDWDIALYTVDRRYPIDIVTEIIRDIGAKLHYDPDGVLYAVAYPGMSPQDLATQTAPVTLDTHRNVFERAEKFINRQNFDCVFVTKDSTLLDPPSVSIEEQSDGDDRILYVYPTPFISHDVLNLRHASDTNAVLTYEGTFTERVVEDILIDGGTARLSKAFTSLVGVRWHQAEIGELTFASNGNISCNKGDVGLMTVTYMTTYLRYRVQRVSNIAKTVVSSDELSRPVLTSGSNPMPPVIVKTLSTPEALTARANAELWASFDSNEYTLNAAYQGSPIRPGSIVRVNVVREELGFNAWVKSVSINCGGDDITQSVTVERPLY